MPGAKSLPFNQLIESDSDSFKDHDQLRKIFEQSLGGPEQFEKVVKGDVRVINSCMAGITASIVSFSISTAINYLDQFSGLASTLCPWS